MRVRERTKFLESRAPELRKVMHEAQRDAHNEEEFRYAVERHVDDLADELKIELDKRQEYTLVNGRADAVYNGFVIEFEPPDSLRDDSTHKHTAAAVGQVEDYITELVDVENRSGQRLLGVATDGTWVIFVRYRNGNFNHEPALRVTDSSCRRFLLALFSLAVDRALIPENLVEDFGSDAPVATKTVSVLYQTLAGDPSARTEKLFEQWQLFFSQAAGEDAATGDLDHQDALAPYIEEIGEEDVDIPRLLFALHTYFSFVTKLVGRLGLQSVVSGGFGAAGFAKLENLGPTALRAELRKIEDGEVFKAFGLHNLLEGDFFRWYLKDFSKEVSDVLSRVVGKLARYDAASLQTDPHLTRDLLKGLYQKVVPRPIRHDLGEYYTPDWLAERTFQQLDEPLFQFSDGVPDPDLEVDTSLLDPACGSGTFLILAIRAAKENMRQLGLSDADILELLLDNVVGFDINPLAVTAARVNYILAILDLLPHRRGRVTVPVYLADSVKTPARGEELATSGQMIFETVVGDLPVPPSVDNREKLESFTGLLEEYVSSDVDPDAFAKLVKDSTNIEIDDEHKATIEELYEILVDLDKRGLNHIWPAVVKNAFMPLFLSKDFDCLVGNPPWINWEHLPESYRQTTTKLWKRYELFVHKGMDAILGKGRKDFSTLMAVVALDRYLKSGGRFGLLITRSVWKGSGAAEGFRQFWLPSEPNTGFRVERVEDLSSFPVFENASSPTTLFVGVKGVPHKYPVPYEYWQKTVRGKNVPFESTLEEALQMTRRLPLEAMPVDGQAKSTKEWLTVRKKALPAVQKILGQSPYEAHVGAYSGANAVYWVHIHGTRSDGNVVVENVTKGARKKVEQVTKAIEPKYLHHLLQSGDLTRWSPNPKNHILVVQDPNTKQGIDPEKLFQNAPRTFAYLKYFEDALRSRALFQRYYTRKENGRRVETAPFYSMFNVGPYTFAEWKVVWGRMGGDRIDAAVIPKEVVPQETISLIGVDTEDEAHYLAAAINSSPFQLAAYAYAQAGGKSFGGVHLFENIHVPHFDASKAEHQQLVKASQDAHDGNEDRDRLDDTAADLWGLTEQEMQDIRKNLAEFRWSPS